MNMQLTNWRQMLEGEITENIFHLSLSFRSCAIGERLTKEGIVDKWMIHPNIPWKAYDLGCMFTDALRLKDKDKALQVVEQIELVPLQDLVPWSLT